MSWLGSDLESGLGLRLRVGIVSCLSLCLPENLLNSSDIGLSRGSISLVNDQVIGNLELRELHDKILLINIVVSFVDSSDSC